MNAHQGDVPFLTSRRYRGVLSTLRRRRRSGQYGKNDQL